MAITLADFNKIWASTSPLTPYSFSASHYKEGWNFIGSTPPSRQMWDFLQKQNDEKSQYLLNNFDNYLPLSGGTMTGWLSANINEFRIRNSKAEHDGVVSIIGGEGTTTGASLYLYGTSHSSRTGWFDLSATDGTNRKSLLGQADGTLTWNNQPLLPVGIVQAFAGTTIPNGWLLCDGSAVSRTDYAELYAVIGDTYGAGDGTSTFNLPNLTDKFIQGNAVAGTEHSAGLPNIYGKAFITDASKYSAQIALLSDVTNNAFSSETNPETPFMGHYSNGGTGSNNILIVDASRSSSIYGNSTTVQPPALTMRYIIKY